MIIARVVVVVVVVAVMIIVAMLIVITNGVAVVAVITEAVYGFEQMREGFVKSIYGAWPAFTNGWLVCCAHVLPHHTHGRMTGTYAASE